MECKGPHPSGRDDSFDDSCSYQLGRDIYEALTRHTTWPMDGSSHTLQRLAGELECVDHRYDKYTKGSIASSSMRALESHIQSLIPSSAHSKAGMEAFLETVPATHVYVPECNAWDHGYKCRIPREGQNPWNGTHDVVYVVVHRSGKRLKFGISNGDGLNRLASHRADGYTVVERLVTGFPKASNLERVLKLSMALAEFKPVRGREYFPIEALPIVLETVDR